ncbi:myeloid cell surface antigen CD33-like [Hemitrygon akajei]|uniref:myeloid cell surface antigen CD33-like n=1 Tax=Hemitrygon akajei TaxID=2704970 RepID=UPI003BF9BC8B
MIGKWYFLLSVLQAVVSEEWTANIQQEVTVRKGLCAHIQCRYSYPSRLANDQRVGIWFNSNDLFSQSRIAFHSKDSNRVMPRYHHRTRLSGNLNDNDCSLNINNVTQEDEGPYHFRIEFNSSYSYSYSTITQLRVVDFTDKPSIFPAEMVAGKPVNIRCTFNISCGGSTPSFTWITPSNVSWLNSSSVTERADTLTYTSVLTFTPALTLHGQNLTCRFKYISVSSEQTVTLTVRSPPTVDTLVVSLAAAGVVVALFILVTLTWFVLQSRRRTNRPDGNRGKREDKSEIMFVRDRLKMEEHYYSNSAQLELTQGKAQKHPDYKLNRNENEDHNVYENFHCDEDSIYANM